MLLLHIYPMNHLQNCLQIVGPEQEKASQKTWAAVQTILLFGSYEATDPMGLMLSLAD